jgi:hypothetical protein
MTEDEEKSAFERLSTIPLNTIVFNGIVSSVSLTEITSIVTFGQRPVAMLVMAPAMAKALGNELLELAKRYEGLVGQPVPNIVDIIKKTGKENAGDF